LVGETGCGKTVTALSLLRLIRPPGQIVSGQIYFEGKDILHLPESDFRSYRGKDISLIFQDPYNSLNPVMKIGDQLAEVFLLHQREILQKKHERMVKRISLKEIALAESSELLASIGIADSISILERYPHELSGGMRQRVVIAIALACQPKLLICDEPTTALDVTIEAQILELIKSEKVKRHNSILFITHDLAVISDICDYVAIMKEGKIVEYGSVTQIFENAKHPYTQQLISILKSSNEYNNVVPSKLKVILSVQNFSVSYPITKSWMQRKFGEVKAVNDINFDINEGETLGLVGESGCGKTSMANAILGLIPSLGGKTAGEIKFEDSTLPSDYPKELRRKIQIVFQDPDVSLNPRMRVVDIIGEPLRNLLGMRNKNDIRNRTLELLKVVEMTQEHLDRYPHEFSGGQKQRVVIARALACNPEIIVLDEPTSALDICVQAQILNLLKDLQRRFNLTYLFISHDLNVIRQIGHRVAVMYLGKLVEIGTVKEMFSNPKHPYTQALLSSRPTVNESEVLKKIILVGEIPSPAHPPHGCQFHPRCFNYQEGKGCELKYPERIDLSETHSVWCSDYDPKLK
jgi:oligopeptide/dipeptide ABC transporter ATP-binding protein